jgi:hypothetical protein
VRIVRSSRGTLDHVRTMQGIQMRQGELGIKFWNSPLEVCYSAGIQLSVGLYSAIEAATF